MKTYRDFKNEIEKIEELEVDEKQKRVVRG